MTSQSHKKDQGGLSISTWQALQGAHHYSERSKIASGRQVHLPWKHIYCQESCTLMMKSVPGLPKLVQHLANNMVVFWIEVESGLTQSCKSTKLWCCQHNCMHVYQWHAKRLNHFHTSCLRKLLKIKWQDRIPDIEVLKRAGIHSVHSLLKLAQLRWTGHVTRMPEERLPKKIL